MAIGAKKITLPIENESTGVVSNVEYTFVQTDTTLAVSGAAADAKKTGDEITSLKQDCNNVPSNKVSVHLSGKRTHEGVVVTTDIGNVKNTFMVLPVQYDVFNLESGVNKLRLFALFNIPEEYLGRCLGAFYLKKYTSEPSEMLTNTTDGIQRGGSANVITNTVTGCLAVNISFTDADWSGGLIYRSLRLGIEIYTDTTRSTLERVIYSEQFTYKTNSMNPFSAELTNASSSDITDEGAIWGGYLAIPKSKYNNVFGISDFEYLSQIADSKTESGSNPGVVSGLVPYEENKSVVSVLRYGDIYSVSNAISIEPPSTITAQAVSSGDTFMLDGLWYKATTDLAVGDTLVVGTNCEAVGEPVIDTADLKQDFNEYHPDLGSGYSAQILSTVFIEDEVPYNFRTSGGSADIGDREYDEIVGVSMPINQYVDKNTLPATTTVNGVTYTNNGDGSITVNGTATDNSRLDNIISIRTWLSHKYLLFGCPSGGSIQSYSLALRGQGADVFDFGSGAIWDASVNSYKGICIYVTSGTVNNLKFVPQFTDLTITLGTQIADYVYGLETATAGSGVSWLKHHFPKIFDSGYIPYNAGEMQSVSGLSAHKMTGFNQWDEETEDGGWNSTTGEPTVNAVNLRNKNPIHVLPGTPYHTNKILYRYYYDANMNYIGYDGTGALDFTTPSSAWYMNIRQDKSDWDGTETNIGLKWDGERDGEYEAYKEYEYPLDDSVVLRGKLELDSNNNLRANGDRYLPDGTLERRYTEITVAESNIESVSTSSTGIKYATINISTSGADTGRIVNSKGYKPHSLGAPSESGCIRTVANSIYVYDNALTDLATAKSILTGMVVVYEKTTASTESATPYTSPQIVDDWGTEEYVSTSLVPVGHDTKYANNLRAKLEMSPDSPEEDGDYIVRHNNGENEYVALGSTTTIQGILDRLTALENA